MKNFICKVMSHRNAKACCDDTAITLLRVFVGLTMAFSHGLGKLPPPEMLVQGVQAMGFPAPEVFAWCAALAEFAGGLFLAAGLLTRPAAVAMAFTMAIAAFVVHAADPFQTKEMAFLYLALSIFFVLYGARKYSLDYVLFGKKK